MNFIEFRLLGQDRLFVFFRHGAQLFIAHFLRFGFDLVQRFILIHFGELHFLLLHFLLGLIHRFLQLGLLLAAAALAFSASNSRSRLALGLGLIVAALNFEPFYETLWGLQAETPLLVLLTLCVCLLRFRRDAAAGFVLGVCIMLKIYPAFLLLYFVMARRWRAIGWCAAAVVLLQASSLIVVGPRENFSYFFKRFVGLRFGVVGFFRRLKKNELREEENKSFV